LGRLANRYPEAEWPQGKLTATDIGILIGKTRNAVIGKCHRLKLGNRAPSGIKVPEKIEEEAAAAITYQDWQRAKN